MTIEKGKIDFSKIPLETIKSIQTIATTTHDYKKHMCEEENDLFNAFVLYVFSKISNDEYSDIWARFVSFLGLTPKDKGIKMLQQRMANEMKDVLYTNLWKDRKTDHQQCIEMEFHYKLYEMLKNILIEKHIVNSKNIKEKSVWNNNAVLLIYKRKTGCHIHKHEMISATAVLTGRNNSEIDLNVEHCPQCKKFYMSYTVYETYREKYGMLLGKLRMDSASVSNTSDVILSEYSPLKLNGYSVNQQDGYSKRERQYILSTVIEKKILTKSDVIRYLEYFINMNGRRTGNEMALAKWKDDLSFVLQYKIPAQNQYQINQIKKY